MSAPVAARSVVLAALPTLELDAGFWERAGLLRGRVLATGFKARLADALIAQACIDHDVALIGTTRTSRTSSDTACVSSGGRITQLEPSAEVT